MCLGMKSRRVVGEASIFLDLLGEALVLAEPAVIGCGTQG